MKSHNYLLALGVAALLIALVAQLFLTDNSLSFGELNRSKSKLVSIETFDHKGHFLVSESAKASAGFVSRTFSVTNTHTAPLHCSIESVSCGCIDLKKDGADIGVNKRWRLATGESATISLTVGMPRTAGLTSRSAILVAQAGPDSEGVRHRLNANIVLHNELTLEPPVVRIGRSSESSDILTFTGLLSLNSREGVRPLEPPHVELIGPLSELIKIRLRPQESIEHFPDLWRHSWEFTCEAHRDKLQNLSRNLTGNLRIALAEESSGKPITAPVIIYDANKLETVRSLHFGEVVAGQEKRLPISVRSLDGKSFSLGESTTSGAEPFARTLVNGSNRDAVTSMDLTVTVVGKRAGYVEGVIILHAIRASHAPAAIRYSADIVSPTSSK